MKKYLLFLCIIGVFALTACGKQAKMSDVTIDYGSSSIYSKEDMDAAIKAIKSTFKDFEGCELHSISYSSDDKCNTSDNIAWMNQCIMFTSDFHSPKNGGGAWNPDEEYTGWQWWMARSNGGKWKLMTWGY